MKILFKLGVLLSLLGLSSIIGEYIHVQRTITEEVPYTVQVVVGFRWHEVDGPCITTIYNCSIDLRSPYTIVSKDFTSPWWEGESLIISWSSTRDILLFAFMIEADWLFLYDVLALGVGQSTVEALLRGDPVNQSVLLTLQDFILNELPTYFHPDFTIGKLPIVHLKGPLLSDCYKLNSSSGRLGMGLGMLTRKLKIVVIDLNSTEGTVNVGIDVRREYSLVTINELICREETRYRTEERTVEEPLFVTPRIDGVEGNLLGFASLITGTALTVASGLKGRKPPS